MLRNTFVRFVETRWLQLLKNYWTIQADYVQNMKSSKRVDPHPQKSHCFSYLGALVFYRISNEAIWVFRKTFPVWRSSYPSYSWRLTWLPPKLASFLISIESDDIKSPWLSDFSEENEVEDKKLLIGSSICEALKNCSAFHRKLCFLQTRRFFVGVRELIQYTSF